MGNNLKDIRRKIASVQNTQKTTKAMKLVSASKLKKAEDAARASRAFALKLNEIFEEIVQKISPIGFENINTPIIYASKKREVKTVDLIFITAEKGLCGGFNQATLKEVSKIIDFYQKQNISLRLRGIGKKGISYFSFNQIPLLDFVESLSSSPDYEASSEFLQRSIQDFIDQKTDEVILVHNGFKSMISQEIKVKKLLPLCIETPGKSDAEVMGLEPQEKEEQILEELSVKYVQYNLFYALLDSLVAEHSARIQAMDAATNNAGNLVKNLTISYNKARQEAITTELVEINAGVEAMK